MRIRRAILAAALLITGLPVSPSAAAYAATVDTAPAPRQTMFATLTGLVTVDW